MTSDKVTDVSSCILRISTENESTASEPDHDGEGILRLLGDGHVDVQVQAVLVRVEKIGQQI